MYPVNQRAIPQTNKSQVSCSPGSGVLENWGGWGVLLIRLSFGDLLTLVKFNTVKKCQRFLRIFLCVFSPTLFYHSGPFPYAVTERSASCIDILPSLSFMKGKSFTSGKKRHWFFPIRFVLPLRNTAHTPSPAPLPTFHFYHRKRKWMSACACV